MAVDALKVQTFLGAVHAALLSASGADKPAGQMIHDVFEALEAPKIPTNNEPVRLPVCCHLDIALANACKGKTPASRAATALQAIAPELAWWRRPDAASAGHAFADGHGNAIIVGRDGLVQCGDAQIGVSLLAPNLQYVDHQHPPEEVYLVLSNGDWRQSDGPWHEPGIGGVVYNPSDIVHSMRSKDSPLLAVWCLWS